MAEIIDIRVKLAERKLREFEANAHEAVKNLDALAAKHHNLKDLISAMRAKLIFVENCYQVYLDKIKKTSEHHDDCMEACELETVEEMLEARKKILKK